MAQSELTDMWSLFPDNTFHTWRAVATPTTSRLDRWLCTSHFHPWTPILSLFHTAKQSDHQGIQILFHQIQRSKFHLWKLNKSLLTKDVLENIAEHWEEHLTRPYRQSDPHGWWDDFKLQI